MPNRNPSPKSRFLESKKLVSAHNDLFSSDTARMSVDLALLQYQNYLCDQSLDAAALFNRMKGAQDFVNILMNLGEAPHSPTIEPKGNLVHSK